MSGTIAGGVPRWFLLIVGLAPCVPGVPVAAQGDDPQFRDSARDAIAQVLEVREDQVEIEAVRFEEQSSTYGQRPTCYCRCLVRSTVGRTIGWVDADLSTDDWRVYDLRWRLGDRDDVRRGAREFVASHFPGWSENMTLRVQEFGDNGRARFKWYERVGGAWTGTFAYVYVYTDQPGRPYTYGGYVATPRSMDDVQVTREQAIQTALEHVAGAGLQTRRLEDAELYLDSPLDPYPHWNVTVRFGAEDTPGPHLVTVIIQAETGEVIGPHPADWD